MPIMFKGKECYNQQEFEVILHYLIEDSKREFKKDIKKIKALKHKKEVYA